MTEKCWLCKDTLWNYSPVYTNGNAYYCEDCAGKHSGMWLVGADTPITQEFLDKVGLRLYEANANQPSHCTECDTLRSEVARLRKALGYAGIRV